MGKRIIAIICLILICNGIHSQPNEYLKKSDSIGNYDIDCIVVGIVKLDSLASFTRWYEDYSGYKHFFSWISRKTNKRHSLIKIKSKSQFSTGRICTRSRNIPLCRSMSIDEIKFLVCKKDYFLIEDRYNNIMKYIYPRCSDAIKKRLEYTVADNTTWKSHYIFPMPTIDTSWVDVIKSRKHGEEDTRIRECFFYNTYKGINEYLLVIMNIRWRNSLTLVTSDPPIEYDDDLYVKYLIPLKPKQDETN